MKSRDAEPLTRDQAEKLYEHIRAIEDLEGDVKEIRDDITERKKLVTESLPVQKDVLDFVLKRRKHSKGELCNFDTMLQLVEEAVAEVEQEHADETRERIRSAAERGAHDEELDLAGPEDDDEAEGDEPDDPDEDGDEEPPFETDSGEEPAYTY